jgi:hypothetical protein
MCRRRSIVAHAHLGSPRIRTARWQATMVQTQRRRVSAGHSAGVSVVRRERVKNCSCCRAVCLTYDDDRLIDVERVASELRAVIATFQIAAFAITFALLLRARIANVGERNGYENECACACVCM